MSGSTKLIIAIVILALLGLLPTTIQILIELIKAAITAGHQIAPAIKATP